MSALENIQKERERILRERKKNGRAEKPAADFSDNVIAPAPEIPNDGNIPEPVIVRHRYVTLDGNPAEDRVLPEGDCPIILTANTVGSGATMQYTTRQALDAASMNRFSFIETGYENQAAILSNAQGVLPSWYGQMCDYLTPGQTRPVVYIYGPTQNGKTFGAKAALREMGYTEYLELDMRNNTGSGALVGRMEIRGDGKGGTETYWVDGIVTRAFRAGLPVIINEVDLNPHALMSLQSAFQMERTISYPADLARDLEIWADNTRPKLIEQGCMVPLTMNTLLRMAQAIHVYGWDFETAVRREFIAHIDPRQRAQIKIPLGVGMGAKTS